MPGASEEIKTSSLLSVFEPMTAVRSLAQVVTAINLAFELGIRSDLRQLIRPLLKQTLSEN